MHAALSTTEVFLIAIGIIFTVPYLIWRVGRTDYYAPLVVVQIFTGILLGPGLMKSGKATRIGVFCGQMYVVPYTDAQAKEAGLRPTTVTVSTDAMTGPRRIPPDVEIGAPDFGAIR